VPLPHPHSLRAVVRKRHRVRNEAGLAHSSTPGHPGGESRSSSDLSPSNTRASISLPKGCLRANGLGGRLRPSCAPSNPASRAPDLFSCVRMAQLARCLPDSERAPTWLVSIRHRWAAPREISPRPPTTSKTLPKPAFCPLVSSDAGARRKNSRRGSSLPAAPTPWRRAEDLWPARAAFLLPEDSRSSFALS